MSIKDEIERIGNNVSDALAATAEMGATVPDGANSDDLGDLIRSIPTGGSGGGAPMWIYAYGQSYNSLKVTTKDGYESDFEVDKLFEISRQRPIFLKTQVINVVAGKNVTGYFGYKGDALFHGFYYDFDGNRVPATAEISVNASNGTKQVAITDEKWAGSSVDLNITPGDSGGGGTSIDVTASVGQTIVVKEVDANGKPTAWEAVDHQPRTHWTETGTGDVLPETIPLMDGDGMGVITSLLDVKVGSTYTVTWNGVNYECVGQPYVEEGVEMGVILGNFDAIMETGDTGEPFVIIAVYAEYYDGGMGAIIYPLDGTEEPVVKITGEMKIVHTLEAKYLPELRGQKRIFVNIDINTVTANSIDFYDADVAEISGAITIIDNGKEYSACDIQKEVYYYDGMGYCKFWIFYIVPITSGNVVMKKAEWSYSNAYLKDNNKVMIDEPPLGNYPYANVLVGRNGGLSWRNNRDYAPDRVVLQASDKETGDAKYYALTVDYSTGSLNVTELPKGVQTNNLWS